MDPMLMSFPLSLHHRQYGADTPKHAFDIHVDHALPLILHAGSKRRQRHDPGIVHENIDTTPHRECSRSEGSDGQAIGNIEGSGLCHATGTAYVRSDFLDPVASAGAQEHVCAACTQFPCDPFTDPAGSSGYQNCLSHLPLLFTNEWLVCMAKVDSSALLV